MPRTLALTGATGFVGPPCGDSWFRRVGGSCAFRRLRSRRYGGGDSPGRWVCGSLYDPDSLRPLLQGAAAVVHCAGAVRGHDRNDFDQVNVGRHGPTGASRSGIASDAAFC